VGNDATASRVSGKGYAAHQYRALCILAGPAINVRTWTLNEGVKVCWLCVGGDGDQLDFGWSSIVTDGHNCGLDDAKRMGIAGNHLIRPFPSRHHLAVHFHVPVA
jgi:hypothetical protein